PLQLFQLVREREDVLEGALPLVGREAELETLRQGARRLQHGEAALLGVTGAAGMGKTRLLEALAQELAAVGLPYLRGTAAEGERRAPLALWRAWLMQLLPVGPGAGRAETAGAIRAALAGSPAAEWADWLAALAADPEQL